MELIDNIHKHLDNGDISVAIFLDLSKAFEMLNHSIMFNKVNILYTIMNYSGLKVI